jgi:hypothetical protein
MRAENAESSTKIFGHDSLIKITAGCLIEFVGEQVLGNGGVSGPPLGFVR